MPLITKILKPEEFTAVKLAELDVHCNAEDGCWERLDSIYRQIFIDNFQRLLDALKNNGVIG